MEKNSSSTKQNHNKETLSVRIKPTQRKALDALVTNTGTSRNDFVENALQFYIEFNEWQLRKIETAVAQADAGKKVSKQRIKATIDKLIR
jgi:predicted transcriptional regulator